jgi:hypothetical protein
MATTKEAKKLTALEKAERSSIAWAEKGDPYSCLDFRILLLKNPKVKPPGFTDRDIASYFGRVSLLAAINNDLDNSGYSRNIWGKSSSKSKRRASKTGKYGSLTSTLSTWVGKKPSSMNKADVDKIIDSLKPETIENEGEEEEVKTKLTTVRRDWSKFGKRVKSEIKTKIIKNENKRNKNNNVDSEDGGKTARSSPRPSSMKYNNKNLDLIKGGSTKIKTNKSSKVDNSKNSNSSKMKKKKSPRSKEVTKPKLMAPAKEVADEKIKEYKEEIIRPAKATPKMSRDQVGTIKGGGLRPHPPNTSNNTVNNNKSKNPSSTFGNRNPRSKLKMKLIKKDISNNKTNMKKNPNNEDNNEDNTANDSKKKEYGPSSWRNQKGFVSPRMRLPSKPSVSDKKDETTADKHEVKAKGKQITVSSWRKDVKNTKTNFKKEVDMMFVDDDNDSFFNDDDEDDHLQFGNNGAFEHNSSGIEFGLLSAKKSKKKRLFSSIPDSIQTKTLASLNKSGGQTSAINAKIKVAMRVLIPLFNQAKNLYDETSTLQALETLQKIAGDPKGALILSNMKMIDKLKIVIGSTKLSSNIQGAGYNILATMISTLAKLGNCAAALNGTALIDMIKSTFIYVTKIFGENLLYNEGNGTSVGKSYEESSKMEGVVSAVAFIKSIVEFIRRVRPNLQEHFVYSGGLHILLILSYCNIKKASRAGRVILQRFELRELMHLSSPNLDFDLPMVVMNSSILKRYDEALKAETLKRVERTRREHALIRKQVEDSSADTPRTEDAGIRRERLNNWLQKRDAEAAKDREKIAKRKLDQLKIQKEIKKMEMEKAKAEAATRAAIAEKQRMLLFARHKEQKNVSEEQKRRDKLALDEEHRRRASLSVSNRTAWLEKKRQEQIRRDEMEEKIRLESIEIAKKLAALRKQKHDRDMAHSKNQYTEYNR